MGARRAGRVTWVELQAETGARKRAGDTLFRFYCHLVPEPDTTLEVDQSDPRYVDLTREEIALEQTAFPGKKTKEKAPKVPKFWRDIAAYRGAKSLVPGPQSPVCAKCALDKVGGASCPYVEPRGSEAPLVTVILEGVSAREDRTAKVSGRNTLTEEGSNRLVRQHVEKIAKEIGLDVSRIRYSPLTRCANLSGKKLDLKPRGNWCRAHLVQDLSKYRATVLMPVGTTVLGRLSHKSSAQDWAGRVLTYRDWPDDWLTQKRYDDGSSFTGSRPVAPPQTGHPDRNTLMVPIQAPYLVWAAQNPNDIERWHRHIRRGLELALHGATAPNYDRPWFNLATTADEVVAGLRSIPDGVRVAYDLETTGLFAYAEDASIVFAMFRWTDPVDGTPRALGFPWLYAGSPIGREDVVKILPEWRRVLYQTKLVGHNVTFDLIYTYARLPDIDLVKLTNSLDADTRLMLYALRQTKESLGLELIAYDWAPDMAGYEEEFELLKRREPELLDPAEGKGGHYANVPRELWNTHLKPYVMGDVEVAAQACSAIDARLNKARRYKIPLADPDRLGTFREFEPPGRAFMYRKFMLPAQRVLTRMMARGMHVDQRELADQEDMFPKAIKAARASLREVDPRVLAWCQQQQATEPGWELDLENREQLSTILFNILECPVKRLTDSGIEKYGEEFSGLPREEQVKFAAIDKFTLNALVAENPALKPLQDYRKLYKQYTAFVRSMRNIKVKGIDKKEREKEQYLQADGRVHASFNLAGTRSGRLACSKPNLQQLPRDSVVKRMYASRFGPQLGAIYQADLSQIELRLLAAACGDPLMVRAYREKMDLHSLTASKIFKKPYEHFLKAHFAMLQKSGREKEAKELEGLRSIAKTTNFLTGYGGGAFGLQTTLAETGVFLPVEGKGGCEEIVEGLFDTYPCLRKHIGLYKRFILDNACAVSITGRVRVFEEVYSEDKGFVNKALRSGFNHLIQSTASDLMMTCLAVIEYLMREEGLESVLVSTVHDSIVIDAVRAELPRVHEICESVINNIPEVMQQVMGPDYDVSWLQIVPLEGDSEVGISYGEQRKVVADKGTGQVDWDALFMKKAA